MSADVRLRLAEYRQRQAQKRDEKLLSEENDDVSVSNSNSEWTIVRQFSCFCDNHPWLTSIAQMILGLLILILCYHFDLIPFGLLLFAFFALWRWGLRAESKSEDEPSAYSVFNPNCERITGTFTAEQYEQSLRRGGGLL